ncbi:MAG: GNAT family N-acetyltransferase [Oscillospiraceae bacterium]|nr:GNAT family N-acetyltransferase [Oscillospiraceae bacterium]
MLELIARCPEFVSGYRDYCRELYDAPSLFFRPTDPDTIDDDWFERTKPWYDRKEKGLIPGQPVSFHYWAVDGDRFIGEFQFRPEFSRKVLHELGNVGYAVRPTEQGKGYGTEILRRGLELARSRGMTRVLLTIDERNAASLRVCEKLGGVWDDTVRVRGARMRRYWIALEKTVDSGARNG